MDLRELTGRGGEGDDLTDTRMLEFIDGDISRIVFYLVSRVFVQSILGHLLVRDWDQLLARADRWKWRFDGKHAIFAQRGLDALWIGSFRQQELTVVLSVHRFALRLLLVFRVDL